MVEKDISIFLEEFRKTDRNLSDFNYLWKQKDMSCVIYCSPNPKEQYDYVRELLEYLVVGIDRGILIGKGAVFVLYTYFVIQPPNPWQRINIPITNEELRNLKCLVQAYCDNQEHDVVYLFNKLLAVQAFEVIPTHNSIVWGNKSVPKERFISFTSRKDVICKPTAVDTLFCDGSVISKLQSLALDYIGVKEAVSDGKVGLDCVSTDLHQKMSQFEQKFQDDVYLLRGGDKLNDMGTSKRKAVKAMAMAAPVDDRTPLQKKRGRRKSEVKEANLGNDDNLEIKMQPPCREDYIPFPK